MRGKTVVITGATSGIGQVAAGKAGHHGRTYGAGGARQIAR
jgi:short-subunit dehydrogenase